MQCDLDEEVKRVGHPYIAVLVGDSTIHFFIVERLILEDCKNFIDAVIALLGGIVSNFICYAFYSAFYRPVKQKVPLVSTHLFSSADALR